MREVRPWIGSYVSVCEFTINRDLVVVDLINTGLPKVEKDKEPDMEVFTWWAINVAFLLPVTRTDDTADYAPTQIIAEAFRQDGADGLAYGSIDKLNVALFDLSSADAGEPHLYRVDDVTLSLSDCSLPEDDSHSTTVEG